MRALLADENFPLSVVNGLIAAGYDVLAVARINPGIDDRAVLDLARETARSLLTFDSDFGDLVFSHRALPPPAILYFRIHPIVADDVLAAALRALSEVPDGAIAVITRDDTRLRRFDPID
jgi:predicted nuclease of predicted toxin-antitoxin system